MMNLETSKGLHNEFKARGPGIWLSQWKNACLESLGSCVRSLLQEKEKRGEMWGSTHPWMGGLMRKIRNPTTDDREWETGTEETAGMKVWCGQAGDTDRGAIGWEVPIGSANHSPPGDLKQDLREGLQPVCGVCGYRELQETRQRQRCRQVHRGSV